MSEDPRAAVGELALLLQRHFGPGLRGLYLFGSLATGSFRPGKSDLDLLAVLDDDVADGEQLGALEALHAGFVSRFAVWHDRVEVGYVSHGVLQSFGDAPAGRIAVISPGEPLHVKNAEVDWLLNWHSVCNGGETLLGPAPLELGPAVTRDGYRRAVKAQLREWQQEVRRSWVAYVPAHQGYIVATVCRALHVLATGRQASKEHAVAWAVERFPEQAAFITEAFGWHRADVAAPHRATIRFVDEAVGEAERL
jgi:hypothetical protein